MCAAPWAVAALIASLYWLLRPSRPGGWGLGDVAGTWGFGLSAGALLAGTAPQTTAGIPSLVPALAALAVPSAGFGAAAICVVRMKYGLPLAELGLRVDRLRRRAAQGMVGALAAIAAGGVGQLVTVAALTAFIGRAAAPPGTGLHGCVRSIYELVPQLKGNPAGLALAAAVVGLAVPIGEEILFRGLAQGALRRRFSRPVAVVIGALIFTAAHLQPAQLLALGALGLVLGYLYDATGSLVPGMIAHGLHNLVMLYVVQLPRA
jgi:uncharacterized protein